MGNKGGGGGSSGGGGNTSSTVMNQPWGGLIPYLSDLYKHANTAKNLQPDAPWGGPLTASTRPESIAAQDYTMELADSFQNAGAGTMQLASDMIAGKYLDPNSNPYFAGTVQAALHPIEDEFYQNTLPAISDQAIGQGAYGGDREGITKALASTGFTRNLADTSANMAWNNYANERSLQMWAPQLMQEGEALQMAPAMLYGGVGDARQQAEQAKLDEALGLYREQQNAPWTGFSNLSSILQGGGAGQGSSYTQGSGGGGGTGSDIFSGLLGGAALGGTFGKLFGLTGADLGLAAGGGAGIGSLLPLLALL